MRHVNNLVLGFGTNQSVEDIRVFINSLRRVYTADECDCVLIVDQPSEGVATTGPTAVRFVETINSYQRRRTATRRAKSLLIRVVSKVAPDSLGMRQAMERWHHPHFARWLAYERFLQDHPEYDQVLLTDVRDVMFQRPFFTPKTAAVQLFEQDTIYGTGNCDSDWYEQAWGSSALAQATGKPALCIGTILGPRSEVLKLIRQFIRFFSRKPFRAVEQAMFNHMLLKEISSFAFCVNSNRQGPVVTLANPEAGLSVELVDGTVKRRGGDVVPIVHMYDRFEHTASVAQAYS